MLLEARAFGDLTHFRRGAVPSHTRIHRLLRRSTDFFWKPQDIGAVLRLRAHLLKYETCTPNRKHEPVYKHPGSEELELGYFGPLGCGQSCS